MSMKDHAARRAAGAGAPRSRRWAWHVIAPLGIALGVGAIVLGAAGETFRPATQVHVTPVVFDRTPAPQASADAPAKVASVQAPGWLEADPFYIACTALADGVVDQMLVLEGEHVDKGEVVARLVDDDARLALARADADLAAARATLDVAEADVRAAQTDWDNPVERERAVGTSKAALAEAESELAQLPTLIDADEAVLERMREELSRLQRSFESAAASDIEVIILEKNVQAQAASTEALRLKKPILEAQVAKLRAEAAAAERAAALRVVERRALEEAQAAVAQANAGVMQAQARRAEAALRLDRMVIRAPISGYVLRRIKVPGDKVMLGMDDPHSAHLVHLYDPAHLQVRVDVPLADAPNVRVGQACEVVVEVLPERVFAGEVTRITHEADIQKNTLQVKVRVVEPLPILRPEMLTRVKFLGSDAGSADAADVRQAPVFVRADCLTDASDRAATVWAVRSRRSAAGVAEPVGVTIIEREDDWISVRGDLHAGDLLVTNAADLRAGQRVHMLAARDAGGPS